MKKKRRTIDLPTQQEIDRIVKRGDIGQLIKINERLAKTANQRMAQLVKSGIKHSTALERAKYYTEQVSEVQTGGVFSRSKKLSLETYAEHISEELTFLRSSASTVSGEKEIRALKSFQTLTRGKDGVKPYLDIPKDIEVPSSWEGTREEYFQEKFISFLEQDAWKDIKKFLYTDNTNILAQAGEAIARGANLEELKEAYKAYLRNEIDIFTMWDDWVSV